MEDSPSDTLQMHKVIRINWFREFCKAMLLLTALITHNHTHIILPNPQSIVYPVHQIISKLAATVKKTAGCKAVAENKQEKMRRDAAISRG